MCTPMHLVLQSSSSSSPPPHTIGGSLYIGSLSAVCDTSILHAHTITHLVQLLDEPWPLLRTELENAGYQCYEIILLDQPECATIEVVEPLLEGACGYIERCLRAGGNVLVHCHQGVSRSASFIIAYLIRYHGMTYDSAFALLKRKRACVKPNPGFVSALREWEWEAVCRRPAAADAQVTTS